MGIALVRIVKEKAYSGGAVVMASRDNKLRLYVKMSMLNDQAVRNQEDILELIRLLLLLPLWRSSSLKGWFE